MKKLLLALSLIILATAASAHSFKTGKIEIGHPWAMPPAANATEAEVYLALMNMGEKADTLTGAAVSIAHKTLLHDGKGVVQSIELPVKQGVAMRPGAAHIKLSGLKGPLVEGDKFTLRLTFAENPAVDVQVYVENHAAH
jgi:periplasmic copper chaperone A